jgi:hypothetical protein
MPEECYADKWKAGLWSHAARLRSLRMRHAQAVLQEMGAWLYPGARDGAARVGAGPLPIPFCLRHSVSRQYDQARKMHTLPVVSSQNGMTRRSTSLLAPADSRARRCGLKPGRQRSLRCAALAGALTSWFESRRPWRAAPRRAAPSCQPYRVAGGAGRGWQRGSCSGCG